MEGGLRLLSTTGRAAILGREAELDVLRAFVGARRPGRSLLLTGSAGIGKSTLWEAGIEAARERGFQVLAARPSEAEARLSHAALADFLAGVGADVLAALPIPQRHALDVALLRQAPTGAPLQARAVAAAFLQVLRELARHSPVLVAVDDVPWLDAPSAAALTFAARRVQDEPVAFLLARRAGGAPDLERTLAANGLERLEVGALSLGATRRLLHQQLGLSLPRRTLLRLFQSTRGNPLFTLEVGRTLIGRDAPAIGEELPVPELVEDLLGVRLTRHSPQVRKAVLAVALSADLQVSELAALAGSGALDDALDSGLLALDGERVRASHPLVAAVARNRASARERRALHRELAGIVGDAALAARHLSLAAVGHDRTLASKVAAAAATAAARGATEDAVELAERALELTPPAASERAERLFALADYLLVAGEQQRAADLLATTVDTLPAGSARVRAELMLAESRFAVSHVDEYGALLERALEESRGDPPLHALAMARKSRFLAAARVERIAFAEQLAVEALPVARRAGADVEREVLYALGWARMLQGRAIDDLCERFRVVSHDASPILRSLDRISAERLSCRGHVAAARAEFVRLLALADERGEVASYAALQLQLFSHDVVSGDLEAAARTLDELVHSPDGDRIIGPTRGRCQAWLELARGFPEQAERWAADEIARSDARGVTWDLLIALSIRGLAALLAHRPQQAAACLRQVWQHTQREGVYEFGSFPVAPHLVEALAEDGELDEALAVVARLQEQAREQDHPWALVTATRCLAVVQLASGTQRDDASSALAAAAARYGELGLRSDRARTLLLLGRGQRRLRRWAAARDALEQAVAAYEEMGAPGWAAEARSDLARVGARRRGVAGELTPTERRVVDLASEGHANKEIAAALFVSVHTVESHLTRAYAKLGVRSRGQLRRVLR